MEITDVMQAAVVAVAVEVGWARWWQRRHGVVVTSHGMGIVMGMRRSSHL